MEGRLRTTHHRESTSILPSTFSYVAIGYIALSAVLFVFTLYFTWARVTVRIIPKQQAVQREYAVTVRPDGEGSGLVVDGVITSMALQGQQTFTATGSVDKQATGNQVGEVDIVNTYTKEQALVEKTRLTLPDDTNTVIVRLAKTVTVPAGQTVRVPVYAENPDTFTPVTSGRLVMPGLWKDIQDKIYAQVTQPLQLGGATTVVTKDDIAKATTALNDQLQQQALEQFSKEQSDSQIAASAVVRIIKAEPTFSAGVGDAVTQFQGSMSIEAVVVGFAENQLLAAVRQETKKQTGGTNQKISLDPSQVKYTVGAIDPQGKQATVTVATTANVSPKLEDLQIDPDTLTGLTTEEVQKQLAGTANVERVEVEFHPGWLKKTPRFSSKIDIVIGEK
jgi:hypothetical protein